MSAYTGIIQENTISLEKVDLKKYNGKKVLVIIDNDKAINNGDVDLEKFILPKMSERAKDVESYIKELRVNDRI